MKFKPGERVVMVNIDRAGSLQASGVYGAGAGCGTVIGCQTYSDANGADIHMVKVAWDFGPPYAYHHEYDLSHFQTDERIFANDSEFIRLTIVASSPLKGGPYKKRHVFTLPSVHLERTIASHPYAPLHRINEFLFEIEADELKKLAVEFSKRRMTGKKAGKRNVVRKKDKLPPPLVDATRRRRMIREEP